MSLDKTIIKIQKRYGEGAIYRLGDKPMEIERFSSGSILIDDALGGGVPWGRIIEIYGEESSGKSTGLYHMIAEAQKKDYPVALIDGEHATDPTYMQALGVNLDNLYISQPTYLEQALNITEALIKGGVKLIGFDSTNALPPLTELEGESGDAVVGLAARLFSQACRKLNPLLKETGSTIVFISQIRQKIGVRFGSDKVVGVGKALKFYASIRLAYIRTGSLKDKGGAYSNTTKVVVKKNKTAPPFKETSIEIRFGEGYDLIKESIQMGIDRGLVIKSGSWFKYPDIKTGEIIHQTQGEESFRIWLLENPERLEELRGNIRAN